MVNFNSPKSQHNTVLPLMLQDTPKVLFLIHLAIGDFAYLQSAFRALKDRYPNLEIDLFVLESRCTDDPSKWELLKNDVIYDWLEQCGLFRKVYRQNYAPHLFLAALKEAKKEKYPLIISFGDVHSEPTEKYARQIASENSTVAGVKLHINWYRLKYQVFKRRLWKHLDIGISSIPMTKNRHISELFAHWFKQIGDLNLSFEQRLPYIEIPEKWNIEAQNWILKHHTSQEPIIFINYLAKDPNRSWRLSQAIALIQKLQALSAWKDALFILNTTPDHLSSVKDAINAKELSNTIPFSATENFYQIPAILKRSHLIISVETSIMHLANAVDTPLIALMRQKTPFWRPLKEEITEVIWCKRKKDKIKDISPQTVFQRVKAYKKPL